MTKIQQKEYFAFISYQRKDEEWAERLRNKLEHYRLPSSVRKQDASLPKEVRPIFRDALELAGGVLAKEIETALQNSKYLIVICSPNSAKSSWVNKEIQTFIDLGREDRIIPFIIDGTPFSDDEDTECFPPALRSLKGEKELLGININELSRDAASIKVVARMLGLKFDTLWQRFEREKNRKRLMVIGGTLIFAFVSLGVGVYIAHQNRELDAKNKEVVVERDRANAERDRANSERDRAETTNASLILANDSIKRQYSLIEKQKNDIAVERDNVKSANYAMQVNLSRILAKEASKLVDEGDAYLARLVALRALPPNLPYTVEGERALRKASYYGKATLRGHTNSICSTSFSSDGKLLVTGSTDNTIRIWDVATGMCLKTLVGHTDEIRFVEFSPNSNQIIVSTSRDRSVRLWTTETGTSFCIDDNCRFWCGAKFSRDGSDIIYAKSDSICIWNIKKKCPLRIIKQNTLNFSLSSDGKSIASIRNERLNDYSYCDIIDYSNGRRIKTITWNCPTNDSGYDVHNVSFSNDDKHVIMTYNESLAVLNTETGEVERTITVDADYIGGVVYCPNDLEFLTTSNKKAQLWDEKKGNQILSFSHDADGLCISVSPAGNRVAYSSHSTSGHVVILSMFGKTRAIYTGKSLYSIGCSPNGDYFASASYEGDVDLWDKKLKKVIRTIGKHEKAATCVSFSRDGKRIVSSSLDNSVRIWDVNSSQCISCLEGHTCGVWSAVFSPDQQFIASASCDSTVRIWNISTSKCINILKGHKGAVLHASYSPNGKYIVSASLDKTLRIWDAKTGETIKVLRGHADGVVFAYFSHDGNYVASSSDDHSIRIWDINRGTCLKVLKGHTSIVSSVVFSHDDRYVVSSSLAADNTVRVWDVTTGRCVQTFTGHKNRVHSVIFDYKTSDVISASTDGTIRFWNFPPLQELIDKTRERFKNRQLTPEERRNYYLE